MSTLKKRANFFETEEGMEFVENLRSMQIDKSYNTGASYSANNTEYPDNLIPFVDKHKNYLNAHPAIDAKLYIANLRLMTKVR